MSKFLDLVEGYDPENSKHYTDVHDFKMFLKSHGVKFGVRGGGVFYIDDADNNQTFVVKIEGVNKAEEDGEALDVLDANAPTDPKAAKVKNEFMKVAKAKLPPALKLMSDKIAAISRM